MKEEDVELTPGRLTMASELELDLSIRDPTMTVSKIQVGRSGAVDIEEPRFSRKGQRRFHFKFKPRCLLKEMTIPLWIWGKDNAGVPFHDLVKKNLQIENPFRAFAYASGTKQMRASEPGKGFSDFHALVFDASQSQPLFSIIGPPGIGKTAFCEGWRHWAIEQAGANGKDVGRVPSQAELPVILIAHPQAIDTQTDSWKFAWSVDQAIADDFENYSRLLPKQIGAEVVRALQGVEGGCIAATMKKFTREALVSAYSANDVVEHAKFVRSIATCFEALVKTGHFRKTLIVVIDDVHCWTPRNITWLSEFQAYSFAESPTEPQIITVVTLRYPLDIIFGNDDFRVLKETWPVVEHEPYYLSPLHPEQVKMMLYERLPEPWADWWEDDQIELLLVLTGGNPEAVGCLLENWWEMSIEGPGRPVELRNSLPDKKETIIKAITREQTRLVRLWLNQRNAIFPAKTGNRERRRRLAIRHLQAVIPSQRYNLLRRIPRNEWLIRVGNASWNEEIVSLLERMHLVKQQGKDLFRLEIPVLSMPISAEDV